MAVERFVEYEDGLCVRWGPNQKFSSEIADEIRERRNQKFMLRDLWDSVEQYEEYKNKEQGIDRNTE